MLDLFSASELIKFSRHVTYILFKEKNETEALKTMASDDELKGWNSTHCRLENGILIIKSFTSILHITSIWKQCFLFANIFFLLQL